MAESKIYTSFGTPITFGDSAQSYAIALNGLAANVGIYSNRADFGAGSVPTTYLCRASFQKGVAGVVNEIISVYVFTSDGTLADGTLATTGTTLTTAMLPNAWWMLPVVVESTTTSVRFTRSGLVTIPTRYCTIGVMNSLTGQLLGSANACVVSLTPIIDAIQPSA